MIAAPDVAVPLTAAAALSWETVSDRFWIADQLVAPLLALALLGNGFGGRVCARISRWAGGRRYVVVPLFAVAFALALQLLRAPIDYFWVQAHARAAESPPVPLGSWLGAQTGSLLSVSTGFAAVAFAAYALMRWSPRGWWLLASVAGSLLVLAALLVEPSTRSYAPLGASALDRSIAAVAMKAGVPADRIGTAQSGERPGCGSATVIGLGPTRLMLLDDTLVSGYSEGEVLQSVAHESSHFVHDDNVKAFAMLSLWLAFGLLLVQFAGGWAASRWGARFGFTSIAEPASLPLVVLVAWIAYIAVLPFARGYQQERVEQRADRFALDITHDNRAEAMLYVKDMHCYPLTVAQPSRFHQALRATHPSIESRIRFANAYHPWRHAPQP